MSARTITIPTADHGDVHVVEPDWCSADHTGEAYREDIEHSGAETHLVVYTPCHGPVRTLPVGFLWRPFSPTNDKIMATVLTAGDWHEFDPADLDRAADALVEHAATLRVYARQLAVLQHKAGESR
ncbi:hypothetical protein ABZ684_21990 [Streptomyces sp. NPDC006995]|uniref:DUF6907 domain-containing protein n=1 Tax=Streptomyces sp. NPDC006995 TaxID=3156907 RepID=UPI0033D1A7DD